MHNLRVVNLKACAVSWFGAWACMGAAVAFQYLPTGLGMHEQRALLSKILEDWLCVCMQTRHLANNQAM